MKEIGRFYEVDRFSSGDEAKEIREKTKEVERTETDQTMKSDSSDKNSSRMRELQAKAIADSAHFETKNETVEKYGHVMSKEQIQRIKDVQTRENLIVMSPEQYHEEFNHPDEVMGHCSKDGEIFIKDVGNEAIKHISVHETMHLCSYKNNEIQGNLQVYESGIRRCFVTKDAEGKEIVVSKENEALNEGMTEMYTLRLLHEKGETDAASSIVSYSESRIRSEQLEAIVGKDMFEKAYFSGDKKALENEVNRLCDSSDAWKELSRNMDLITYSRNHQERLQAKIRLECMFNDMLDRKEELRWIR